MNELPDVDLVREKIVHCIIKDGKNKKHLTSFEKNLQNNIKKTRTFLRDNKDLLVTRADKGNATVIINKNAYINKVELQLNNTKYYSKLPKNPISKLRNYTKHIISVWNSRGVFDYIINLNNYKSSIDNSVLARAYGLIKIHKTDFPVRIIVSNINSPINLFDKAISEIFKKYLPRPKFSRKNSSDLKIILDKLVVPNNYSFISLDVISLFTNLHSELVIAGIRKKWKYLQQHINL